MQARPRGVPITANVQAHEHLGPAPGTEVPLHSTLEDNAFDQIDCARR
jgi:hypothetical protein